MATDEAWRLLLWAGAWVGVWADGLPHRHVLAPGFHVSWGFETRERLITFAVEAQTRGWVGLGLTRSGGMEGADMAVGWVKDGRQYFHDRYAVGNEQPLIDKSQDLTLLSLTQNGSHTLLKYRRPFRTCDSNDLDITDDTTQLIFACSSSLPSSISSLPMHDSVYGVKSVQILNYAPSDIPRLANASVLDILTNFTVPQTASFYSCKLEKFPDYGKKIHIYMVEPVIRTQDPDLIFQMILYGCPSAYGTSHLQLTEDCFANQASTNLYTACSSVLAVWGLGTSQSQPLIFPEEAGISLGALGDPEFYVLQIHYDNRRNASGVWDNSGFRIHLTSEIRENDLGILWTGIALFQTLLIPPKTSAYKTYGSCNTSPISQNSNQTSSEVKILAGHLHTHLLGRSVRVLQFRNGQQVSVVLEDKTFDPTLQEPKFAKEPVTVPRGDILITECTYNTEGRTKITKGGLDTIEEMCMSFLLYYPKFEIATCFSYQDSRTVANALGVSANSDSDLYNTLSSWNWTEKVTEDMQEKIRDAPQYLVMSGDNVDKDITSNTPSIPAERVSPCVRAQTSVSPHVTAPNLCSLIVLLIAWGVD